MPDGPVFADRSAAGRELAEAMLELGLQPPLLVLGLPRGGVPVAYEVARALDAPLDVLVVRKVGMPGQPEFAIGAIASGDITVREADSALLGRAFDRHFEPIAKRERIELQRREQVYRRGLQPVNATGRTVVLVDDGLATGSTMVAAVRAARAAGARSVVVAAPVASDSAVALLRTEADRIVILKIPASLFSIGEWYEDFGQVEDAEVCALLERGRRSGPATSPS
jgi:predicted phosphoribosyltransferase